MPNLLFLLAFYPMHLRSQFYRSFPIKSTVAIKSHFERERRPIKSEYLRTHRCKAVFVVCNEKEAQNCTTSQFKAIRNLI